MTTAEADLPPRVAASRRAIGSWAVVAAVALLGWRGGIDPTAELVFAAAALIAVVALRPRVDRADPVQVGLAVVALANLGVCAVDRAFSWPVLAATCGLAAFAPVAAEVTRRDAERVLMGILAIASASAVAGVTAVALHLPPAAERIAGIWRAGGTLEYPPALAVVILCGLAALAALAATGAVGRISAGALGCVLGLGLALSYDRAGWVLAAGLAAVWMSRTRLRGGKPVIGAGCALLATLLLVALASPGRAQLGSHLLHGPLEGRTGVWSDAWTAFRARPLDGYGPGGFARIYRVIGDPEQITLGHNLVVEQAVEAGAVAALGAALIVVFGLYRAGRGLASRDPARLAFACIALVVLASGLYDFTWSFPPIALMGVIGLMGTRGGPPEHWAEGETA